MFNLFKKKSPIEKLQEEYKKLSEEAFKLSKINRQQSDAKQVEAEAVLKKIDELKAEA